MNPVRILTESLTDWHMLFGVTTIDINNFVLTEF